MISQLFMFVFRLGILSFLLSECLVSGFTTAAAIHVFTSQVKDLLGLQLPKISGNYEVIKVSWGELGRIGGEYGEFESVFCEFVRT
jgi:MFS superfamily sulfate permease-like transporter